MSVRYRFIKVDNQGSEVVAHLQEGTKSAFNTKWFDSIIPFTEQQCIEMLEEIRNPGVQTAMSTDPHSEDEIRKAIGEIRRASNR